MSTIKELAKAYDPKPVEEKWGAFWLDEGLFTADPKSDKPKFSMVLPPPNVTGILHMGHALCFTLPDVITRWKRMQGHNCLWLPGTDHASIAVHNVIEKSLAEKGLSREKIGRDEFLRIAWEWKAKYGGVITSQLKKLGASLDWSRERFTMDPGFSRAVKQVFVSLYDEGLIYRDYFLVNRCPHCRTVLSDIEIEHKDLKGKLWHIRYAVEGSDESVVVATTRPETMLGDTGLAVHPDDERYTPLHGKRVILPLQDKPIPVITDERVERDFGTGAVKVTPAHDPVDFELGKKHGLEQVIVIDGAGKMTEAAGPAFAGLDRFAARAKVVEALRERGLLVKIEDHDHAVGHCYRCKNVIEPHLSWQWFVRIKPLADEAIRVVESGEIQFIPANWTKTYYEWMYNIHDWCISRQLWWGHRIPAWYCRDCGHIAVALEAPERCPKCGGPVDQDEDVLDTWFSSGLWPFGTLGWPDETDDLETFYPTDLMSTGFDIIFFWVARMIMMGLKFTGEVPFREVYIHGLVRDAEGQKMSKSKGNVLDPIDLIDGITLPELIAKRTSGLMQPQMAQKIEQATRRQFPDGIPAFGTDALRYTFWSLASTGRDIKFDLGRIEGYRNFCNKLWNAARFVLMNCEGQDTGLNDAPVTLGLAERWIISRLQRTEATVREQLDGYRFDLAASAAYEFVWGEYCDWYLELAKTTLQDAAADAAVLRGTRRTLVRVLETALRLLHPFMPFITEALWQSVAPLAGRSGATVMTAPYPTPDASRIDAVAEADMEWLQAVVMAVRNIRGEMNIPPGKRLPILLNRGSTQDRQRLESARAAIEALVRAESIFWLPPALTAPPSAIQLVGELEILVPMADLIDVAAERARLERELEKIDHELGRIATKLDNADFVARAPEAVVTRERDRRTELLAAREKLQAQHAQVSALGAAG